MLKASAFFGSRDLLAWTAVGGLWLGVWGFFEATHDPFGVVFLLGWFSFGLWRVPACFGSCRCALMESLILAQDERWRRA